MNLVILWKEYRQQRALWLAMAALGVILTFGLANALGPGRGWQIFRHYSVQHVLVGLVYCLALAYGVICGALLLAGDREDATQTFLDNQAVVRGPLWQAKFWVGILLAGSQGVFLIALGLVLRFLPWEAALILPVLIGDALVWGLVGGSRSRNVLLAVLAGIGFLGGIWILSFPLWLLIQDWEGGSPRVIWYRVPLFLLFKAGLICLGAWLSRQNYCWRDRLRMERAAQLETTIGELPAKWAYPPGNIPWRPRERQAYLLGLKKSRPFIPARAFGRFLALSLRIRPDLRVLLWLIYQQGRWVLVSGVALSLALGLAVNLNPLFLWPAGTLLLGIICGLAVFAPEQLGRQQAFLGSQRFPPTVVWVVKIGFWGLAALSLTLLAGWVGLVWSAIIGHFQAWTSGAGHNWSAVFKEDVGLFIFLWMIHGFCLGQFFGQLARRPIIAAILTGVGGTVLSALWLPSVLSGGRGWWPVVPLLLLATTRLLWWPWVSGRLYSFRPVLGIAKSLENL